MGIFSEIKECLPLKQAVEHSGIKVGRNGMACCPFHPDKSPSMKLYERNYHCFGCGAHGDVIDFTARLNSLSQHEAALCLIRDFSLPLNAEPAAFSESERLEWQKVKEEHRKLALISERFRKWRLAAIDRLKDTENGIHALEEYFKAYPPEDAFESEEYIATVTAKPVVGYWLDILCFGTESEQVELFMKNRKEVEHYAERISGLVGRSLEECRKDIGRRIQQCR